MLQKLLVVPSLPTVLATAIPLPMECALSTSVLGLESAPVLVTAALHDVLAHVSASSSGVCMLMSVYKSTCGHAVSFAM
jgi:hypothetical protein